jgi:hypothetical protein
MKPTHLATVALIAALAFGAGPGRAEDRAPAAAPPAAAENAPKVLEPAGGCMPDGSCCGHGACAHAAAGADKAANGSATDEPAGSNAADSGGGCPCAKMKKAM